MKKILILFAVTLFFNGCSDEDYEELNKDLNNPAQASAEQLFTSATKSLFDQMESTSVNRNVFRLFAQYWTETTYIDEANYDLGRKIPQYHWSELYRDVLYDLADAKAILETNGESNSTKVGQITVLEIYTWQILVDTFGDIPYTEALKGKKKKSPKYDDDEIIYNDLVIRLDAAIGMLGNGDSMGNADIIYKSNVSNWKKFANSLKLKIGSRLIDHNLGLATTIITEAVNAGVFTSSADDAKIDYEGSTPNTNPIWIALVQSGRNDFIPANTIVDHMNTLVDPRRPFYFKDNLGPDIYTGGVYGKSSDFSGHTHVGNLLHDPTYKGVLLDFVEVKFNLAEAVEQGIAVGGTAKDHYNDAINASMLDWGVSSADATTYLTSAAVNYDTAVGTWREKIGMQYWIAMYNRGFEGWYVYRKFDAPTFNIAYRDGLPVPNRYTYPINEQSLNEANWKAASTAIGGDGDKLTTKVFWDKN